MITVSKNVADQEELEKLIDIEDLIFVKALPLNEKQVNIDNLHEFSDMEEIFNTFNVDLLFTLEAMTTKFIQEPAEQPDLGEVPEIIGIQNKINERESRIGQLKQLQDEEEEEKKELIELSYHDEPPVQLPDEQYDIPIRKKKKRSRKIVPSSEVEKSQSSQKQSVNAEDQSQSDVQPTGINDNKSDEVDPEDDFYPNIDQQVGRISQKIEPDEESQNISKDQDSNRIRSSLDKKSQLNKSMKESVIFK